MIVGQVRKQPNETFLIGLDFVSRLQSGETVNTQTVTSKNIATGSDSSAALLQTPAINGSKVEVRLRAGLTSPEDHRVQFRAGTSLGNTYEDEIDLQLRED